MNIGKYLGRESRWYGHVPITITLATGIGLLVLVAVSIVFGVGVWLAQKNTFDLLSANAHQTVAANVSQVEQHLQPAEHQTRFIASQITQNKINLDNDEQFGQLLVGALAAVPQIEAVMFIDNELQSLAAGREPDDNVVELGRADYSSDPIIRKNMESQPLEPVWQPPIWRELYQKTYLNRVHPVIINNEFMGVVVAVVSVQELSTFISDKEFESAGHRFILYGRDKVLAHWLLASGYPDRSDLHPLPLLNRFTDPVLASIWQKQGRHELVLDLPQGTNGHMLELYNDGYAFVYQRLFGYGPQPLIVGAYFQADDVTREIRRMIAALFAGIAVIGIALIAAVIIGRRIARPIVRFSSAASRIRDLEVAEVEDLPGSVFRELNDQSVSFNAMLRALRWFELYVPKKIVQRLIMHEELNETISDEREITVMFTDIAGFSAVSEHMSAPEVAVFVNHHFSLVSDCIEAEEGTIDKFMGDAVMAFWGAPDHQRDSAERACRAGLAIADTIHADNRQREAIGEPPVGIRIGIHSGKATVGNIGAPGRLNYTIIGDTVNIGQRLEQLGKEVYPLDTEISVLISNTTAEQLGPQFKFAGVGKHKLKGRSGEIEVFKLHWGST